jgi:hypothetical protein
MGSIAGDVTDWLLERLRGFSCKPDGGAIHGKSEVF